MPSEAVLRAVGADERPSKPARKRVKTVTQAAKNGTERELLVAVQIRIAKAVESPDCSPRDLAALSRRLIDLTTQIRAIDDEDERDDEEGGPDGGSDHSRPADEDFDPSSV